MAKKKISVKTINKRRPEKLERQGNRKGHLRKLNRSPATLRTKEAYLVINRTKSEQEPPKRLKEGICYP